MATQLDYVVPTGEYIEEWLEENQVSQADLARSLGCSPKHVSLLIHGAPLTHDIALRLERVTGTSAERWMRLESFYRSELARLELEHDRDAVKAVLAQVPLKYLREHGFVRSTLRQPGKCAFETMAFYRAGTIGVLEKMLTEPVGAVAFRQSARLDWAARLTWIRAVEVEAAVDCEEVAPSFDRQGLTDLLPELRSLTRVPPDIYGTRMKAMLAQVGVRLVFAHPVPRAGTYGIARWYAGSPLIALSLHRKSEDQFWFTLFHELFHVVNHELTPEGYVSGEWADGKYERQADEFASGFLIPPEWDEELSELSTLDGVKDFAERIDIAPGIVVGRLHRDELWHYSKGQGLIRRLRLIETND